MLWLRERHVEPERIRWVVPRDSWLIDRPFALGLRGVGLSKMIDFLQLLLKSTTVDDYYDSLERNGFLWNLDPGVKPVKNRGATVTAGDVDSLRTLEHRAAGQSHARGARGVGAGEGHALGSSLWDAHRGLLGRRLDCSAASQGL